MSTKLTRDQLRSVIRTEAEAAFAELALKSGSTNRHFIDGLIHGTAKPTRAGDVGLGFARVLKAFAASGGDVKVAQEIVAQEPGDTIARALAAGDATAGGLLIEGQLAAEVIDLLRPRSVVRAIGPRVITAARGTFAFPKIETSASAGYVQENAAIPISEPSFGQVVLTVKKLAALVNVSNELLTFTGNGAEATIRDDLVKVLAATEDLNFIRGNGLLGTPKGLRNWALAANVTASNGTSSANIESDFKDLVNALEGADVPMTRPAWIMAPRSKNHLWTLRDANGNLIFPEIRSPTPVLYGWPVFITTNIPTNLGGGGNETEIYFVDADEVILGEVEAIQLEASRDASYVTSGSTVVSAFQNDQTLIRATLLHDLGVRHPESVAVKNVVTWGA